MRHSFPNETLRKRLRSLQIGLIFHARECLVAMVEKSTGFRLSEDWTADELAEIVITLEENARLEKFQRRLAAAKSNQDRARDLALVR